MKFLSELLRRLQFRFGGSRFDEDLAEEMRLHQQLRAEQKQADGMPASDAEAAARRQFGNATRMAEISREAWGWTFLDRLVQDVRYGLRALAANPGFTLTAVLSLALGIGANTAIFSIVNAVMLRSLPVEDPRQLVEIRDQQGASYTNPIWEQFRDHQQAMAGVLAYSADRFDLAGGGESRFAQGLWVSGGFFHVLGVPALRGRVLSTEDDRRGGGDLGPGGRHQLQVLEEPFRRWRRRDRKDGPAEPARVRNRRRHSALVHRPRRGPRVRRRHPDRLRADPPQRWKCAGPT